MKRIKSLSAGILLLLVFCLLAQFISVASVFNTENEISLNLDNGMSAWVGVLLTEHFQEIGKQIEQVGLSAIKWLSLPNLALTLLINFFLIRLFWLYYNGVIFARSNTNYIRWIGWTVIAKVLLTIFYPFILLIVLSQLHPDAEITKIIRINDENITVFLIGCIITVIGHVMSIGQSLKEEQELTI